METKNTKKWNNKVTTDVKSDLQYNAFYLWYCIVPMKLCRQNNNIIILHLRLALHKISPWESPQPSIRSLLPLVNLGLGRRSGIFEFNRMEKVAEKLRKFSTEIGFFQEESTIWRAVAYVADPPTHIRHCPQQPTNDEEQVWDASSSPSSPSSFSTISSGHPLEELCLWCSCLFHRAEAFLPLLLKLFWE